MYIEKIQSSPSPSFYKTSQIIKNNTVKLESAIWVSPVRLYLTLTTMLNDIVWKKEPNFRFIHEEINRFINCPNNENFKELKNILSIQLENNLKEKIIRLFSLYPLLLNISIKTALIHKKMKIGYRKIKINPLETPIKMHLGLYGKETEPSSEELIIALSELSEGLEKIDTIENIKKLIENVWLSSSSTNHFDEVSMQLFYANQIYWNFNNVVRDIKNQLITEDKNLLDLGKWLDCYTWLTTDRDGRPHDTNSKTLKLIEILEVAIRNNYIKELNEIFLLTLDRNIKEIINRIPKNIDNSYKSPNELIFDLEKLKNKNHLIEEIIIKIKIFGFHYLKLEFRDNAKMFSEVINTLLEPRIIEIIIGEKNTNYEKLNQEKKISLLTALLKSDNKMLVKNIRENYLKKNLSTYQEKLNLYKNKDYIELMDIDPDYIKQVNVESTLGRFNLMSKYQDRLHVHAIAETSGPEDALALLFLAKISNGTTNYIDIALQPEDSNGAVTIISMIKTLYQNPIYRDHIQKRGNKQYIIFGPSDTGKQGGKAMHMANMQIAQIHRIIANQYNINPVIHVIVGYEHARCNGHLKDILDGYGTLNQSESEYMMAGLNEMRSQLLTSKQVTYFLSDLFFTHINYHPVQDYPIKKREKKFRFWLKVVDRYQRFFHNHYCLPNLLRKIARFDIINATAKGTRPPSRILNTNSLEDCPSAIRAIPWSRAFLLAGIHCEVIGSGYLNKLSPKKLHHLYLNEIDFHRYVHHIAYGIARTDMDFAWKTADENRPNNMIIKDLAIKFEMNNENISYLNMLAWIDREIDLASKFVYKAIHGSTPKGNVDRMSLLQHINPALFEEVSLRDKIFIFHKALLADSRNRPEILKEKYIKDLFTGALTICNTSLSIMHPESVNTLNWSRFV